MKPVVVVSKEPKRSETGTTVADNATSTTEALSGSKQDTIKNIPPDSTCGIYIFLTAIASQTTATKMASLSRLAAESGPSGSATKGIEAKQNSTAVPAWKKSGHIWGKDTSTGKC